MDLDLMPQEWKSDREQIREPIFGSGAVGWGVWLIGFVAAASISYWLRHL